MSNLSHLNPQQRKAAEITEGRLLILAGAGTGKTNVLTHRMAHILSKRLAQPENILGLTFTNKAAGEMRTRLAHLIGSSEAKKVTLSTFHSFCMGVLRQEIELLGYTKHFSLYDERDIKRLVTSLAKEMLEHEGELPSLNPTIEQIKEAKNQGIFNQEEGHWHDNFAKELYEKLEMTMRAYNAVDFDNLLTLTVELFQKYPDVLKRYSERFRYIMIDEYQDTNPIQYLLANLISSQWNNLCVVGDDDQSIYGWRGAKIENILNFPADVTIKLEQNYRSTKTILAAANSVIKKNESRHEKELWTNHNETFPIEIFHAPDENEEASAIVERILKLKEEQKLKWSDFVILYRSNTLSRPFEVALIKALWKKTGKWIRGIPFEVFGGTEITERSEVKDLMAYLRVIANPKDQEALLRIINFPRRGISDATLDILTKENRKKSMPLWELLQDPSTLTLTKQAQDGIEKFCSLIKTAQREFNSMPLHTALECFIAKIDFKKAVSDEVKSEKMKSFKRENIDTSIALLKAYEDEAEFPTLADFLSSTLLDSRTHQKEKNRSDDKVNLMTIHSAKGLEFPVCFVVGLEDHLIPHEKSLAEKGIEEERRLFYVAITRAKKNLILSMAQKRARYGKEIPSNPSRFLFDIQKELLQPTSYKL